MANTPRDLCRRLELFGIDDTTKTALARLLPFASRELDVILHEFYRTIRAIPQIEKKLVGVDQGRLMQKQRPTGWRCSPASGITPICVA